MGQAVGSQVSRPGHRIERQQVKDLARDLLDLLEASKFVLDWRNKAAT